MKKIPIRQITATRQEQSNVGRFSIRDLRTILNGKRLVHDLHKHDFYFILAIETGTGMHEIDFVPYEVHNNTVFILRPGQVHQLHLEADCTGYLFEFDQLFYQQKNVNEEQRWKNLFGRNYCEVEKNRFKKLHSYLSIIFEEYTAKQKGYHDAIKACLDLFFIEYARQSSNSKQVLPNINNYMQERYEDLLMLLDEKIAEIKSAPQYAALLNLSVYQLNTITKASVGKTTADLINEQIILEAKRYLLASHNQIKDIAWHLGYEDVSYFIRFFKKHTGQSPDAFRKNFK